MTSAYLGKLFIVKQLLMPCACCRCPEDDEKLYSVLFGNVFLIHANPQDPNLKQLIDCLNQKASSQHNNVTATAVADQQTASLCATVHDVRKEAGAGDGITNQRHLQHQGPKTQTNTNQHLYSQISHQSRSTPEVSDELPISPAPHGPGPWHLVKDALAASQKKKLSQCQWSSSAAAAAAAQAMASSIGAKGTKSLRSNLSMKANLSSSSGKEGKAAGQSVGSGSKRLRFGDAKTDKDCAGAATVGGAAGDNSEVTPDVMLMERIDELAAALSSSVNIINVGPGFSFRWAPEASVHTHSTMMLLLVCVVRRLSCTPVSLLLMLLHMRWRY